METTLLETVATHEEKLQQQIQDAKREARALVDEAHETARKHTHEAATALERQVAELRKTKVTERETARAQIEAATEAEVARIREATATRTEAVRDALVASLLPGAAQR